MNNKPYNQNTMKKLITLEKRITQMLTNNSSLRNDNRKLCVAIWNKEAKEKQLEPSLFFENYKRGSLTSADNITRIARLVKQHNVELRGTNHDDNKKKKQLIKPLLKK
jgi:hypothetical protein